MSRILLPLLLLSSAVSAQNTLSVTAGPSLPLGSFSRSATDEGSAGAAGMGIGLGIVWEHAAPNTIGFSAGLSVQRHGLDRPALGEAYAHKPFYTFSPSSGTWQPLYVGRYYGNWDFDRASWWILRLQGGANRSFSLGGSWAASVRALAGLAYAIPPLVFGTSYADTSAVGVRQEADAAFGLSYGLSMGFRRSLGARSFLLLGIDYSGTAPMRFSTRFDGREAVEGPSAPPSLSSWTIHRTQKFAVQTLGLSLGVGFRL